MQINPFFSRVLFAVGTAGFLALAARLNAAESLGYTDTPMLPGQPWHVHDPGRPAPRVVTPGESFSDGAPPPSDAVVLFDGKDLSNWTTVSNTAPGWVVQDGYMEVVPGSGSIRSKQHFEDFQLHLEFAEPEKVQSNSQGRGNSGVKIFGLYEVQVLDTYDNPTYADGICGALYGQHPPLVNACRKPGEWQTYDIIFEAPRWDESHKLIKRANVTVIQNGVVLHNKEEFDGTTRHRKLGSYDAPYLSRGPIELQEHHNPVRFRNVWVRELGEYDKPQPDAGAETTNGHE